MLVALAHAMGCGECGRETEEPPDAAPVETAPIESAPPPESAEVMPEPRCPPDMVKIDPKVEVEVEPLDSGVDRPIQVFCIDRYEAALVDNETAARIPPYYPPSRKGATGTARAWESLRFEMGDERAQATPLPTLPAWMLQRDFEPRAMVRENVTPNGHTNGEQAIVACRNAKKRMCTWREWRTACGGEKGWQFPYGETYEQGACNVFREGHPAAVLHDDASIGHTDPRLNRVKINGKPLLRPTGATKTCASRWGDDAVYDMVGNIDEWLDDPLGAFAGGFYSRSTKDGCEWRATGHTIDYADYSTGVRCCADLPRPR
jgi:hypothetical protein